MSAADLAPAVAAALASPVRREILEHLRSGSEVTAGELAELLDMHVTTVRFHLGHLLQAGLVEAFIGDHAGVGRPSKSFRAVEPAQTDNAPMDRLAEVLAQAMSGSLSGQPVSPEDAGAQWARDHIDEHDRAPASTPGEWLGRVGQMVDVLQGWGYDPDVSTRDGGRVAHIGLSPCPFLALARENQAVVCGVHLGLIRESLVRFGDPGTTVELEPFVTPTRCLATLQAPPGVHPA